MAPETRRRLPGLASNASTSGITIILRLPDYACSLLFFFLMIRHPPSSTLFPYPTLFRSREEPQAAAPLPRQRVRGRRPAAGAGLAARGGGGAREEQGGSRSLRRGSLRALPAHCAARARGDRKSTRLNSSHLVISYAVFCL